MITSLLSFISSAKSTYILLVIMLMSGIYVWFDYQSKVEEIGALKQSIEVASRGTREAIELNQSNIANFDKERSEYKEALDALQIIHTKNRELEDKLSGIKTEFNDYKNSASDETKQCFQTELPVSIFGNLVDNGRVLSDKAD